MVTENSVKLISTTSKRSISKKTIKSAKGKSTTKKLVSPKLRDQMTAEAAYFKALNRNFQGDYCVEDWLEAEKEIDAMS